MDRDSVGRNLPTLGVINFAIVLVLSEEEVSVLGPRRLTNLSVRFGRPGGACNFLLWAPKTEKVDVHIVHPSELKVAMQPLQGRYFSAAVEEIAAGGLYRYCLDGRTERPDPASRFQPQGDFVWSDNGWFGIPLEQYILYEIHVGTFTPQGTFDAIIPRINALRDLGITAIEIMPAAQFPGNRNWGYDGVYPFAEQNSHGGPAPLRRLVNAFSRGVCRSFVDVSVLSGERRAHHRASRDTLHRGPAGAQAVQGIVLAAIGRRLA
jgi:Carbohydrate-binding module 48 (Isoamylase N-terminal domain)